MVRRKGVGMVGIARLARWTALLVGAALAPLAAAPAAETPQPALVGPGQKLYVRHCAVCHGLSGAGDGPFAGILRVAPADLTGIAARRSGRFPDDEIARIVDGRLVPPAHGTREMPVWGRWLGKPIADGVTADEVARGEILALVEYLKTLQRSE
jgi:mono/diheme cytochrome c family protein